ncbi:MAG TPA: DUF3108 domain-containing protein [Azospirillum sp.]|nr:DUF3108 domain-containing protein [Azospirillum sp.]
MIVPRPRLLAACLLAAPLLATALPAKAERLRLDYRVHVGGVTVMEVQALLALTGDRYAIEMKGATQGMLGRIISWTTTSSTAGSITPAGPRPSRYQVESAWRGDPRNVRMEYDGQGGLTVAADPPPQVEGREPVPEPMRHGSVDPLSAHLEVLLAAGRSEGCTRTVPVYDGRRRYDLSFSDAGPEALAASRHSAFAGMTRHCRVESRTLAGRKLSEGSGFWQRGSEEERPPLDVWIAPLRAGGPTVPVRLETDSTFGGVLVHLVAATVLPETAEKP